MLSILSYVYRPYVCPLWRSVCSGPFPFFYWIVCLPGVESWSRVLDIKLLSKISLENIFFHTVGSLFILLMYSLAVQKFFILMRFHLFILSFMSFVLGDISVKILLHGISEIFLPMFLSRTFMVSGLILKSFIHLEFIFVYGVNWWSSFFFFFFFACICPDLPTPFVEEVILIAFYAAASFVE